MNFLSRFVVVIILLLLNQVSFAQEEKEHDLVRNTYDELVTMRNNNNPMLKNGQGVIATKKLAEPKSEIKPLDILVAYHNQPISSSKHLLSLIKEQSSSSENIVVDLIRNSKPLQIKVNPGALGVTINDFLSLKKALYESALKNNTREAQEQMIKQYLKGRPYRTPNNQDPKVIKSEDPDKK